MQRAEISLRPSTSATRLHGYQEMLSPADPQVIATSMASYASETRLSKLLIRGIKVTALRLCVRLRERQDGRFSTRRST